MAGILGWILGRKLLLLFVAATIALGVSTIYLAVENGDLRKEESPTDIISTAAPPTTTVETPNMEKYRLPKNVLPKRYDLQLNPDLKTGLFSGTVTASVSVLESTSKIVLHSNQLDISNISINGVLGKHELDPEYELLNVYKADGGEFSVADLDITISFSGDLKNRLVGFYQSSYLRLDGVVRNIATSKFEPTYARQAFPCFDEPNLKAKYKVHILKPLDDKYIALSNYPVESTETHPDGVLVNFEETVSMSTYLSCFIVSDFEFTATEFNNRDTMVPFKVYATPAQLQKTEYAGEVGKKVIEYYVEYFGLPYPLPKLDMVAIPDFVSGAMEHWGLVTYRETALLYTNETHSSANKQRVATVVAHELAHSWFGNLVTMNWWDDLWLNEGFASYIEFKGVNKAEPTWNMLEQFLIADLHPVLALDSTLGSRPIIKKVEHPDQITEVFDAISYNKGASVLRMLENTVGDEIFKNGVTAYLKKYAYGSAVTQNLLDEIQAIQGDRNINVTEFMNTYTVQMGYPILNVRVDGNKYVLTQERFLIDKDAVSRGDESPYGYKWSVPVTYITDTGAVSKPIMFLHNQRELSILKPEGASWLKFNHHQVGYYRVNYPEAQWKQLIDAYGTFDVSDRTHLLEESFSIARAGRLGYEIPLELTKKLENETEYVPWSVGSSVLEDIAKNIKNSEAELDFKEYVKKLVSPSYERLSWNEEDDDDHLTRLNRVVILALACSVGHQDCLQEANVRFRDWIGNPGEPLSQDLRSLIYKFGMMGADEDTWQSVFEIFTKENDANEKLKLLNGLASVQSPALLSRLIELARNESYVRRQDYFTMLNYISLNPIGTPIVWDYVRENWPYLVQRFTLNDRYLGNLIASITATFATNIKVQEMELFFKTYPEAGAGVAARKRALETVRNNIKWRELYKTTVEDCIINNRAN